jgi:hypothetical protein
MDVVITKKLSLLASQIIVAAGSLFFFWSSVAQAQSPERQAAIEAGNFVADFNRIILFPTIALLSAVAFLVFLWGTSQYFFNAANDQARQEGVKHITFGIIGLVIMVSAFAILSIAASTFGLEDTLNCANDPSAAGCF